MQKQTVQGTVPIPGDKSVSHRAVIFASLAKGVSYLTNFLASDDTLCTLNALQRLGIRYSFKKNGCLQINSPGLWNKIQDGTLVKSFNREEAPVEINLGNSGTAIRLLIGFFSGIEGIQVKLLGDKSLNQRPMERVCGPLRQAGADIKTTNGSPPVKITGKALNTLSYRSPIASAQIKSSLLLAMLTSNKSLEYYEPYLSRNHTEIFLQRVGNLTSKIKSDGVYVSLSPPYKINPLKTIIPGDISSAAFLITAGVCASKDSNLVLQNVGLNPSRMEILKLLPKKAIRIRKLKSDNGENFADLSVSPCTVDRIEIHKPLVSSLIDEIPILSILGLFTRNGFSVREAEELRVKESDRIHMMVSNFRALGLEVEEFPDGYSFKPLSSQKISISGMSGKKIPTNMDHRIVMSFAILDFLLNLNLKIDGKKWTKTSFPDFFDLLNKIRA
jgi:3-phosphoshikimate 1-carboxyvinyltransferase